MTRNLCASAILLVAILGCDSDHYVREDEGVVGDFSGQWVGTLDFSVINPSALCEALLPAGEIDLQISQAGVRVSIQDLVNPERVWLGSAAYDSGTLNAEGSFSLSAAVNDEVFACDLIDSLNFTEASDNDADLSEEIALTCRPQSAGSAVQCDFIGRGSVRRVS